MLKNQVRRSMIVDILVDYIRFLHFSTVESDLLPLESVKSVESAIRFMTGKFVFLDVLVKVGELNLPQNKTNESNLLNLLYQRVLKTPIPKSPLLLLK